MESAFYGYFYISTDCISNTLNTREIELYLMNKGCFISNGLGSFKHNLTFLSIQLMLVKNYNSWSSNDYNKEKTNYITITTSKEINSIVEQFFREFEIFIGCHIIEETDDD